MQLNKQQASAGGGPGLAVERPHAMVAAPVAGAPPPLSLDDAWETHSLRKISFYFCLATLFLRLSVLPELIRYTTHVNTYLLYVVGPPAILSTLLMGGVQRTFHSRAAFYWVAFFAWMVLATPFSSWPGGSVQRVLTYARVDGIFLLLVGGMALNWTEVRAIIRTIAAAAVMNLASTRYFEQVANGRVSLEASGTIGNSNDLAAQLLLVLPFLLFFMTGKGRSIVVRLVVLGLLMYGLWIILGTASRGGLVGLAVAFLYILIHISLSKKVMLVIAAGVITLAALAMLPRMTLNRLGALFGGKQEEATESADSRKYLFLTSVKYTIEHPVFGIGPDQFANFEGKTSRTEGLHGNWHATHCAFTQVSSECGVPAFVFFTFGLGSAMLLVLRTYRKAKREGYLEIATGCFCYLLAMVGYLTALIFLAQAYSFRLPAMVGLGVTLSFAAMRTMMSSHDLAPSAPPAPVPQRRILR
ncbi:MAG: O-antigen ligase family protein [Bryobacteraceae bacterium]|jgi:O-antigen ligase